MAAISARARRAKCFARDAGFNPIGFIEIATTPDRLARHTAHRAPCSHPRPARQARLVGHGRLARHTAPRVPSPRPAPPDWLDLLARATAGYFFPGTRV